MDLSSQVERMIAFMDHEGEERRMEILAKADEEYDIYVGQIVQSERLRINNIYKKREDNVQRMRMVASSKARNESRLNLLRYRRKLVRDIFKEVRERIVANIKQTSYKDVLGDLLFQGLCKILEKKVGVRVREKDINMIKEIIPTIENRFKDIARIPVKIVLDESTYLEDSAIGGVYLSAKKGRISVENTINQRVHRLTHDTSPIVRKVLFEGIMLSTVHRSSTDP